MELPGIILVEDIDGGYIKAQLKDVKENADEQQIPIYKQVEYYHTLESAIDDC